MNHFFENLGFMVLRGIHAPEDVVLALPRAAEKIGVVPRRLALAETLHWGDENGVNEEVFAILHHAGKTIVAKPGWFTHVCDASLDLALSKRFGEVASFHSYEACPTITLHCDGALEGEVDAMNDPEVSVLGETRRIEVPSDVIRVAFVRYIGAPWEEIFPRLSGTAELWRFV